MHKIDARQHFQARKTPRQMRSQSTVESIKQAALELVISGGFLTTSTTRIAERAGVSIGSLYQFFPTREAIFLALFEDTSAQMTKTMKSIMVRILSLPLEKGVTEVVRRLLALHREHQQVLLHMVTQVPELKLATQPVSFENMILDSIRVYIDQQTPGMRSKELGRRAFFLREIILGCIHRYLIDNPPQVTDTAFIADLADIVMNYIAKPPKA